MQAGKGERRPFFQSERQRLETTTTLLSPVQDFGARAPKAGELESNFSDKVLGNWDTSHIIR